jgi:lipopolysaccharide/colanic/teichoic acid biosynthesis glycosyltransferase
MGGSTGLVRRAVDFVLSAFLLVTLFPVFLIVSAVVLLTMGQPIFYGQYRGGQHGRPFKMFKFRTMNPDAEAGGPLTLREDPRIPPMGRLLRKYKIDELPQLVNVFLGQMTFVGPRPEVLDWVAQYSPQERRVLRTRPGLTDPVQILFRHEQDHLEGPDQYRALMRVKVRRQLDYLSRRSAVSDLRAVFDTFRCILNHRASDEELRVYEDCRRQAQASNAHRDHRSGL